jgi:hypothetical protein
LVDGEHTASSDTAAGVVADTSDFAATVPFAFLALARRFSIPIAPVAGNAFDTSDAEFRRFTAALALFARAERFAEAAAAVAVIFGLPLSLIILGQEMRSVAFSVGCETKLCADVVCPITLYCIAYCFILLGHRTSGRGHPVGYKTHRIHCAQPVQMLLTCVDAITVAELILCEKCVRELNEPPIIIE